MFARAVNGLRRPGPTPASGIADAKRWACLFLLLAILLVTPSSAAAAGAQETTLPAKLVAGGKIQLENDLQAWADPMLVCRGFRREFRRMDRFEEVDSEEEADLVGILSADPNVLDSNEIVNGAYPTHRGTRAPRSCSW